MIIYNFDRWNDLNEERLVDISESKFLELLNKYGHSNQNIFLYKKIINPSSPFGIFYKSTKQFEKHVQELKNGICEKWQGYPDRNNSLVCYNYIEQEEGEMFIVYPFKSSLFAISPQKEYNPSLTIESYNKGYWNDKIQWLNKLDKRELWTESPCLLVSLEYWKNRKVI